MQNLKENRKPIGRSSRRNLKNMSKITAHVVPVGAWVELEPQNNRTDYGAILSAEQEERRILQAQAEKQAKLERFRRDVKQRVRQLQQTKRQEQLQESFQAVELQSNVVQQSSHAAECSTPKKDRCLYRHDNEALTIGQPSDNVTSGSESEQEAIHCRQLTERSHSVHRIVTQAKRSLAAKQMFQQVHLAAKQMFQQTSLPGGSWGSEFSRDKQHLEPARTSRVQNQVKDLEHETTESDSRIPQQTSDELSSDGDMENHAPAVSHDPDTLHRLAGVHIQKTVTFAGELGKVSGHEVKVQTGKGDAKSASHRFEMGVNSDLADEYSNCMQMRSGRKYLGSKPIRSDTGYTTNMQQRTVPDLRPGVRVEENKRRLGNQYSMYRRLFMDMEREQVRENIRQKEHQKNIQRLKDGKEKERRKVEDDAHQSVELRSLLTGETEEETYQHQREDQQQMEQVLQRERDRKQKSTEISRYIRALKAMMREKIEQMGVKVPPLCACGPSIWDANPETCANNCLFYKNPKVYAKALHSLLMSCDLS